MRLLLAVAFLFGPLGASAGAQGVFEDPELGVRVELPEGWSAGAAALEPGEVARARFVTEHAPDGAECILRVFSSEQVGGPEGARVLALAAVEDPERFANALGEEVALNGVEQLAFQVDVFGEDVDFRVRQIYLGANGFVYVLQSQAPVDAYETFAPFVGELWSGLSIGPLSGERMERRRLEELAARCGSELDWAASWEDAAARARAGGQLVLVKVRAYGGFALTDEQLAGPFMDPDIVALVQERFVPFALGADRDVPFASQDSYGLSPTTFGAAVLIATPGGEVVAETVPVTLEFLVRAADRHGDGSPSMEGSTPEERAARHLRRGDPNAALEAIGDDEAATAWRLRAHTFRMRRDGAGAIAALDRAREAPGALLLALDLDVDEAFVRMRVGDGDAARELLEGVLARGADHPRVPEARYLLGELLRATEGKDAAAAAWAPLLEEHADSRWAWLAAARETGTAWELDVQPRLSWPPEEEWSALHPPPSAPLPPEEAERAADEAAAWLLAHQRGDGGWLDPTFVGRAPGSAPPHDFELAGAAIAGRALLSRGGEVERAAAARALAYCLDAQARQREDETDVALMDYSPWSRAFLLLFLADAREAELADELSLSLAAGLALERLRSRRRPGGGWSYYVAGTVEADVAAPQSISFTTAAVLLALVRAREVGWGVPDALLDDGLDQLEAMRADPGLYAYMQLPRERAAPGSVSAPGAAGRGPVCALALLRGGRAELDEVRAGLAQLEAHRAGLTAEIGKALMHAGPDGQGAHYVLFDLALAAEATRALPERERPRHALALREELLRARREGGSFLDFLGLGPAAATGLALWGLDLLAARDGVERERDG